MQKDHFTIPGDPQQVVPPSSADVLWAKQHHFWLQEATLHYAVKSCRSREHADYDSSMLQARSHLGEGRFSSFTHPLM